MAENPLAQLQNLGQCVWLDNLYRDLITTGRLKQMETEGVTGITSNPSIFQKAISGSAAYDESLRAMLKKGIKDPKELFLGLAMEDVSSAADILLASHEKTGCLSGFVSIEVSPDLAYDTDATIKEARRIFAALNRKNILVKVPATKQGLPAIEQLTSEGINVNVTLLFSVKRAEEVADAYIKGLERRLGDGNKVNGITSVASFFVSRVDTLVDKLLEKRLASAADDKERKTIEGLFGKAAVANARIAYKEYKEIFSQPRFLSLKAKGANIQRLLWGSSSTKNPKYSDVKYVDELIAPDTVNTMPEATLQAFVDHGKVRITIEDDLAGAEEVFRKLAAVGIDMTTVTDQLEKEGVKAFSDSFFALLDEIAKRRDEILGQSK
jgi:transaldolase